MHRGTWLFMAWRVANVLCVLHKELLLPGKDLDVSFDPSLIPGSRNTLLLFIVSLSFLSSLLALYDFHLCCATAQGHWQLQTTLCLVVIAIQLGAWAIVLHSLEPIIGSVTASLVMHEHKAAYGYPTLCHPLLPHL